jgi:hemerythrin superfamily protein/carbon monoxide dehydrogenase subunit G
MTTVQHSVEVSVPVRAAYDQWTRFEDFPRFMGGVESVTQIDDSTVHWVAKIGGVRREWDAAILEQVPDSKVAWAALSGATNAGAVYFSPLDDQGTLVSLELEFEPEGIVEKAGDALDLVSRQAEADLERFKEFIEAGGSQGPGWRGAINEDLDVGTPSIEAADSSKGDSGSAGLSPGVVVAGAAAVAAGAAAVKAVRRSHDDDQQQGDTPSTAAGGGGQGGVDELDVVDVLTIDHRETTEILTALEQETDPDRRRDLADVLITELVRHAVAEEMYVYPAMRDHLPDGAAAVEHDLAEHQELEVTMKELESLDASSQQFADLVRHLQAVLADHVADEEREQFPQLRASVPRERLVELAAKIEGAKRLAPTRPHPGAPDSALFHKVVGPGVGLVDRVRDRLAGRGATHSA